MKNKQFSKPAVLCLVLGLVILSVAQVLSRYFHLSDFAHGSLIGLGIGVEWCAFILVARSKKKLSR
jgi:hypothetical protein